MNFSDYIVYFWLVPVTFQIVIPLVMLAGWAVGRFVSLFQSEGRSQVNHSPVYAG